MSPRLRTIMTGLALLAFLSLGARTCKANPLPPEDVQVQGGEEAWHASNSFFVHWRNPAWPGLEPVVAVHYRLRTPWETWLITDQRLSGSISSLTVQVPRFSGAYTLEIWLEGESGAQGAPAGAKLRFDDVPPGKIAPEARTTWISRTEEPYMLRLGPLEGALPTSGIRGYAVSVDEEADGDPCAAADRCLDAETDLRGGLEDRTLALSDLPEGTSYVHSVAVSGSGMKSALSGRTTLRVDKTDPLTRLTGAPGGWTNQPVALLATAWDSLSGMAPGAGAFTAIRIDGGAPIVDAGASVRAFVIGDGVHTVSYYAGDAAGNVNDGGASNGHRNHLPPTATIRIDRSPPEVGFLNAQDPLAPETIAARVSDPQSGPDPARGQIAVRPLGSGDHFEPLPTEGGEVLRAHWESDAYPPGDYEFRVIGFDAAGNSAASTMRLNGTGMVLANPLKVPTSLAAAFGGKTMIWHRCARGRSGTRCRSQTIADFERRPSAIEIPYGRRATFSGRLTAARFPLGETEVSIIESFAPGAGQQQRVTTVRTNADGSFTVPLAPGPSRKVSALFAGNGLFGRSASAVAALAVHSGVRLRASSKVARVGAGPVTFKGRLLNDGGMASPGGRSIELQFRIPGSAWSEFRTVETDTHGRFHYAYRFSDDDSRGVRFQFRAYVPEQDGWPYAAAGSLPVAVEGR